MSQEFSQGCLLLASFRASLDGAFRRAAGCPTERLRPRDQGGSCQSSWKQVVDHKGITSIQALSAKAITGQPSFQRRSRPSSGLEGCREICIHLGPPAAAWPQRWCHGTSARLSLCVLQRENWNVCTNFSSLKLVMYPSWISLHLSSFHLTVKIIRWNSFRFADTLVSAEIYTSPHLSFLLIKLSKNLCDC